MKAAQKVVASFSRAAGDICAHHRELILAIHNKRNEASLANHIAQQTALALVIRWESFLNDLLITYATQASARVMKSTEQRVIQSIESKFGKSCARYVECKFPKKPSSRMIVAMVDTKNMNITARTANELATRANEMLPGRYARGFTFTQQDSELYDYAIALRNYLGHFSGFSLRNLRIGIVALAHPDNAAFKATFRHIGPYLSAQTPTGDCRAVELGRRLIELARRL